MDYWKKSTRTSRRRWTTSAGRLIRETRALRISTNINILIILILIIMVHRRSTKRIRTTKEATTAMTMISTTVAMWWAWMSRMTMKRLERTWAQTNHINTSEFKTRSAHVEKGPANIAPWGIFGARLDGAKTEQLMEVPSGIDVVVDCGDWTAKKKKNLVSAFPSFASTEFDRSGHDHFSFAHAMSNAFLKKCRKKNHHSGNDTKTTTCFIGWILFGGSNVHGEQRRPIIIQATTMAEKRI